MGTALRMRGEVTEDGRLVVELPAELPRGPVLITLEPQESDFTLAEDDLRGLGLTAKEIAQAPEIGAWADETAPDGEQFVEQIRHVPLRNRW